MKFMPGHLIPFLTETDLTERIEAATEKWAADGHPLAAVLLDVLFHGADALCPSCYADARDFLLHVPLPDAIALLAWANEPMEDLWAERSAMLSSNGPASRAVYVSERRIQADRMIEGLYTDALLLPGDRDLTHAAVSAAVAQSLRCGVGSAYWWRARSVLELADPEVLVQAIPESTMRIRSLVMLLHSARRLTPGRWWRDLFPMPDAYDDFRRFDIKRIKRRFVFGAGVDADPG